jgi:hypothetical protein
VGEGLNCVACIRVKTDAMVAGAVEILKGM